MLSGVCWAVRGRLHQAPVDAEMMDAVAEAATWLVDSYLKHLQESEKDRRKVHSALMGVLLVRRRLPSRAAGPLPSSMWRHAPDRGQ